MRIWLTEPDLDALNALCCNTMIDHLGIEIIEVGDDYIKASMPVDRRTHQAFGLLHGGASVALAETLGSIGAYLCIDTRKFSCVGLEINANHLRAARRGQVFGVARPIRLGRTTQVWEIRISNAKNHLVCVSRLTLAIINNRQSGRE